MHINSILQQLNWLQVPLLPSPDVHLWKQSCKTHRKWQKHCLMVRKDLAKLINCNWYSNCQQLYHNSFLISSSSTLKYINIHFNRLIKKKLLFQRERNYQNVPDAPNMLQNIFDNEYSQIWGLLTLKLEPHLFSLRLLQSLGFEHQWSSDREPLSQKIKSSCLNLPTINDGVATCPKCDFHTVRRIFHTLSILFACNIFC